jgi:hypothetical protein
MDDNTKIDEKQRDKSYYLYNKVTGLFIRLDNYNFYIKRMRNRIFSWARVTEHMKNIYGDYYILIELSYGDNNDWKDRQITEFMQKVIKIIGIDDIYDYGWVVEIKPIGKNIHYHISIHCKKYTKIPMPDKFGLWKYGSTTIEGKKSSPYYLAKYLSKERQKIIKYVPKGARKQNTWLNKLYYTNEQLMEHKKSAYPIEVKRRIEELGITQAKITRAKKTGGWDIEIADPGHELYQCKIHVESDWWVFKGMEQVEVYLPNLLKAYNKIEIQQP